MLGGTFLPPRKRSSASERPASQRHRVVKRGEGNTACSKTCWTEFGCKKWKTSASGKLCCSLREMFRPLSVAAACSSKLKERQKRLRRASPQALLMRAPKGAWVTSCMPPLSSKKRSAITACCVGTAPRMARPARTYWTACSAPELSRPHSPVSHATVLAKFEFGCSEEFTAPRGTFALISSRSADTYVESSSVRAGASPRQNGTVGAAPCASSTRD